jgi:hypothetical protein
MNPPGGYTSGKVYMKFTKVERGITLYLYNVKTKKTTTINSSTNLATEYDVENGSSMTISAVPRKENFNTTWAIEYWTDGAKDEAAPVFAKIKAHDIKVKEELKEGGGAGSFETNTLPIVPIAAGAGGCVVLIIACVVWRKCKKKNNDVNTQGHILQELSDEITMDPFSDTGKKNLKHT